MVAVAGGRAPYDPTKRKPSVTKTSDTTTTKKSDAERRDERRDKKAGGRGFRVAGAKTKQLFTGKKNPFKR